MLKFETYIQHYIICVHKIDKKYTTGSSPYNFAGKYKFFLLWGEVRFKNAFQPPAHKSLIIGGPTIKNRFKIEYVREAKNRQKRFHLERRWKKCG